VRLRQFDRGKRLALVGCASLAVSGCASSTGEEIVVSRAGLSMAATVAEAERAGHDHDAGAQYSDEVLFGNAFSAQLTSQQIMQAAAHPHVQSISIDVVTPPP
jgi:hypothetical protein